MVIEKQENMLTDRFWSLRPGRPRWVNLTLTDECFTIGKDDGCTWTTKFNQKNQTEISLNRIVGCHVLPKKSQNGSKKVQLSVLAFSTSVTTNKKSGVDEDVSFTEYKPMRMVFETSDENVANQWKTEISKIVAEKRNSESGLNRVDPSKKLAVFVNPKSGEGKAIKMFEQTVRPALEHANIPFELILTQRPNHGREFAATQDLSKWSGLVIVSGDGLLYEVVQGLFDRNDWTEAIKTPLGIMPAGSGNGLARSLAHINREKYDKGEAFGSVLNLVSGSTQPMDITRVRTHSGKTFYSFLSIGWGFLADCDIESERLRFMGEPRFAVWAFVRVVNLRHYKGRLTYKPANSEEWKVIEDEFVSIYCVTLPWIGTSMYMAPESRLADGLLNLVIIRKGVSRVQLAKILDEFESGKHLTMAGVETMAVRAFKLEPLTLSGHLTLDGELIDYGPIEAEVIPGCARLMSK